MRIESLTLSFSPTRQLTTFALASFVLSFFHALFYLSRADMPPARVNVLEGPVPAGEKRVGAHRPRALLSSMAPML